ncbi:minor histocompatibility antigen H13 isoform 1-T1 [Glossophaga mutica]
MDSALSDPHNGSAEAGSPANNTTRPPSTPEGIALAYGSLLLMALLPIFFGALRSVRCARGKNASDVPETITSRDAARFPIIASCTLLGLYLFFKIFSQEYINLLLSMYFFVLGILALSHTISPFMNKLFPATFPNRQYQLLFTQGTGENKEDIINYEFDTKDLVCLGLSSIVGVWYLLRKHWIANNLFGLAFSLNGVELLHLNNVSTGCILLGGLFIYDVFWVFGTNVMVTVARSFEAPIKLVFPQDLLEKGLEADNFAMLGLGDIVIPGIFIALLLRFDISLKKNTHTYFYTSFAAYIFGLGLTIFIMHIFKHAQVSRATLRVSGMLHCRMIQAAHTLTARRGKTPPAMPLAFIKRAKPPRLVWLSGAPACKVKGHRFNSGRAHAWVVGQVPIWGHARGS